MVFLLKHSASKFSEERRKCRFRTENLDLKLFSQYSQSACRLECQVKMATSKCGCVPWDYPQLMKDNLLPVCEGWGRYCFENVVKNSSKRLKHCGHCKPDCVTTRFTIQ